MRTSINSLNANKEARINRGCSRVYIVVVTLCNKFDNANKIIERLIYEIKDEINKIHDYEVAEISSYEITNADNKFLNWIDDNTK